MSPLFARRHLVKERDRKESDQFRPKSADDAINTFATWAQCIIEEQREMDNVKSQSQKPFKISLQKIQTINQDCQWHFIAEIMDRCFLYIFVFLTVAIFGIYLWIGFHIQMN